MTDVLFHDPQLARFYDLENEWGRDDEFISARAADAQSVLDLGCGTGRLAASLAAGRSVTGVEPAAAMLDIARGRPSGGAVRWVEADARTVRLGRHFDLVVMSGHAFQCLLTDEDQLAVCRTIAAHLAPDGRFLFDSRNPACEAWRDWVPDKSRRSFMHPGLGTIDAWNDAHFDDGCSVATYETCYRSRATDELWRATSRIRFSDRRAIAACLSAAGLHVDTWLGDWTGTAWHAGSPEIIPTGSLA